MAITVREALQRTCPLVSLTPQMSHRIVAFLHLQRVILHDRAISPINNIIMKLLVTHVSSAFAYFSKSPFAMSAIWRSPVNIIWRWLWYLFAYLYFHELVCIELVDVLEVIEVLLQHV